MLKRLRIQNFKGWKDTGEIEMKPITLFFGANSSGKSSIGHFLMMLKQTIQSHKNREVFLLGDRDSTLDLGSYKDIVFGNDFGSKVIFDYEWNSSDVEIFFNPKESDSKDDVYFRDEQGGKIKTDSLRFYSEVGFEKEKMFVEKFEYKNNEETFWLGMEKKKKGEGYKLVNPNNKLHFSPGRNWPFDNPIKFYGFPASVSNRLRDADFFADLNLLQNNLFEKIHYLGPLRSRAKRSYRWYEDDPINVGDFGQDTISAMLSAKKSRRRIYIPGFGVSTRSLEETIAHELKKMGLVEEIAIEEISKQSQQYEVKVRTKGVKNFVNLTDVGFGVSQVLPVLVQCFYAESGSIIIIEQPEIHLHPAAQSILADVMIDVIKSQTKARSAGQRDIQLIIETHSEHFLERLQRRIAEENISKEYVSAYFASIEGKVAELKELEIDEFGNISNWPENFFGDEMEDIRERADAVLNRRKKNLGE